jgi:HEAT repeat protein
MGVVMTRASVRDARRLLSMSMTGALLLVACAGALSAEAQGQVAPLAPRWLAGTPPPPVETFAAGLERHNIPLTEPALLAALRDPDGEVRSLAAAQLAAMDDHPALREIVRAIQDERDPQVQVNLAGAGSWLGSRLAIEQLESSCRDVNIPSTARLDAARYISHKQLATCFPAVREIAQNDQDADVRVQAVMAGLSYRGQADGARMIAVRALNDLEPAVRIAGADALRSLRATTEIGPLESALQTEGDETAREHLRDAARVLRLAAAADAAAASKK